MTKPLSHKKQVERAHQKSEKAYRALSDCAFNNGHYETKYSDLLDVAPAELSQAAQEKTPRLSLAKRGAESFGVLCWYR
jgi:hypothetical protein